MCPGWCQTELGGPGAMRTADQGADDMEHLINLPYKRDENLNGKFFGFKKVVDFHNDHFTSE